MNTIKKILILAFSLSLLLACSKPIDEDSFVSCLKEYGDIVVEIKFFTEGDVIVGVSQELSLNERFMNTVGKDMTREEHYEKLTEGFSQEQLDDDSILITEGTQPSLKIGILDVKKATDQQLSSVKIMNDSTKERGIKSLIEQMNAEDGINCGLVLE